MEDAETTDGASSGDREDATTTDGADHMDGGIGGSQTAKKTRSKERIGHRKHSATSQTLTVVSPSGLPVQPAFLAKGYNMQLGCIVRESMSINTKDLRSKANEALVENLLRKLHQQYTFPQPLNKKVESLAIMKMSTALSSWKFRVKKKIQKGDS